MNLRLKRAKELAGYAVQLTRDEGLGTMMARGAGFVKRRFFGKKARYLPAKKVLEAQRAEMAGKTFEDCGLPTISVLTPLYNTPENYLREFLDSFRGPDRPQRGALPCRCFRCRSQPCRGDRAGISGKESTYRIQKDRKQGHCSQYQRCCRPCQRGISCSGGPRRHPGAPRPVRHGQGHPGPEGAGQTGRFCLQRRSSFQQEHPAAAGGPLQAGLRAGLPALLQLYLPFGRVPAGLI